MPFIESSDIDPRTGFGRTPPPEQQPGEETFRAAFRQSNIVASAFANQYGAFTPEEGYNPLDDIKDSTYFDNHASRFFGSQSSAETTAIKRQIDREEADKRLLASSGVTGALATVVAGGVDPTMLLPGRVAFGVLKDGTTFLRGAAEVGTAMAVQSTAQETALQTSQVTRPAGESVLNVGSSTVLGALLGSAATLLSPAEHASLTAALDRDRAALDAHVAGRPEPPPTPPAADPLADIRAAMERMSGEPSAAAAEPAGAPADVDAMRQRARDRMNEIRAQMENMEGRGVELPAPSPSSEFEDMSARIARRLADSGIGDSFRAAQEAEIAAMRARREELQQRAPASDVLRDVLEERQQTAVPPLSTASVDTAGGISALREATKGQLSAAELQRLDDLYARTEYTPELDALQERAATPIDRPIIVYRGAKSEEQLLDDTSHVSTSDRIQPSVTFARNLFDEKQGVRAEIRVEPGVKAFVPDSGINHEVVLAPGTQYEITGRRLDPDTGQTVLSVVARPAESAAARELPPRTPFPENFPHVIYQQGPQSKVRLTEHPDFEAAKKGDIEAAQRVVQAGVNDATVEKIKAQIGDRNPVLVAVHAADEEGAVNVLPLVYAEELSHRLGLDIDDDIKQVHRIKHTGADAATRIANKTGFYGSVEPGRDYYLVDDMVVQGGTFADLRGHIESNGGNVIGATTLMSQRFSHILGPRAETLAELRAKFPDLEAWWHEQFGHGLDAITESEARYLARFGSIDTLRDRVLGAAQANDLSAAQRAKGYWQKGGEGLRDIERLNNEGKTRQEIADNLGISPSFVSQKMSQAGIELKNKQLGGFQEDRDLNERLREMAASGLTPKQIADEMAGSPAAIKQRLYRMRSAEQLRENPESAAGMGEAGNLSEWETLPDGTMIRRLASSGGAAATDTRTLEPVRTGIGLERVPWDPVQATLQSPSISARRAMADLAEVPTLVGENLRGQTTTLGGGPSLETMARVIINQTQVAVRDKLLALWGDMRFEGGRIPVADHVKRWFGVPERPGPEAAPSFEQFKKMVSAAMMDGDVHAVSQIQEAVQFVRAVLEPWAERAEKVFPEFERQKSEEGEGWFPHVWNKNKIEALRPEFVNKLVTKLWGDQTIKRQIQDRLRSFQGALESHSNTIDKLTDHITKRNTALADAQKELDETSRAHREIFKRATELRESEFENVGGVAEPVPGKNREKATELARQETEIRNRLNKAADKVSGIKHDIEDLEHRLQAEHLSANHVRERIEDEIGRWEGKSASEAKSAIKAREKYDAERATKAAAEGKPKPTERLTAADVDVDRAVKRVLKTDQNRSLEDIRDQSNEIVDRQLGSPDGRLSYDEHRGAPDFGPRFPGAQARGSLARRTLDVDNDFARGWINDDIERVVKDHLRTFVPDVLLAERFGDVEMSAQMRAIQDEFAHMIDQVGPKEAERVKLNNQRDKAIENIAAIRDRFRGLYNIPSTAATRRLGRISAAVKNANIPLSLGMAAVSSIPDAAGAVFRWGMTAAFRDAWAPFLKSLMTDRELTTEAMRQFRTMGIAVDTFTAQRHHEFSGLTETYERGSPVETTLQAFADKFQLLNMLGPWTDMVKSISSTIAAQELYRAAQASAANKATPKQMRALAENNITGNMAVRIAEQYEKSGNLVDGVLLPNTGEWTDAIAREHFEGALSREANIAVVTPGLDKPLLFSDPVFSMLLQFKSFTAAATTRIMIANLQRMDAETLQGLVASLAMGMMSYKINAITGGQPTSDRPQDWIKEAMSRGNVLGWLEEGNALASKMTRGGVDIYRLIGADKPLSKFAAQSAPEQLMGPTFGKLQALAKATSGASAREWDASDTKAVRRLIPMQNLVWLRRVFDEVEAGTNNALGVQQKLH